MVVATGTMHVSNIKPQTKSHKWLLGVSEMTVSLSMVAPSLVCVSLCVCISYSVYFDQWTQNKATYREQS